MPIPTAAPPAIRSRKPSSKAFWSWWSGIPYAIWWYNKLQRAELDISQLDDSYVRELRIQLAETGRELWVLDITHDLGIPSFVAMSHSKENGEDFIEFGSGSHFDARIALLRALTELNQFLSIGLMGMRDQGSLSEDGTGPWRLEDHAYLIPNGRPAVQADFSSKFGALDKRDRCGLREPGQARRPRLSCPRPDPARHRGSGGARHRSGLAALLSPLRARPALRCSDQVGMDSTGPMPESDLNSLHPET